MSRPSSDFRLPRLFVSFNASKANKFSFSFNHHVALFPTYEIGSKALLPWNFHRDQKSVRSSNCKGCRIRANLRQLVAPPRQYHFLKTLFPRC